MFTSIRIIVRASSQFSKHNCSQMGAALSYFALFSFAPLLLLAIAFAGIFFGTDVAEGKVYVLLEEYVGSDNTHLLQSVLNNANEKQETFSWISFAGLVVALLAALKVFLHIRQSFCIIWNLDPSKRSSLLGSVVNYILAIVMVVCTWLLLLISLAVSTLISSAELTWNVSTPVVWSLLDVVCSFLFLALIFSFLFWVLSVKVIPFGYVIYGSIICTVLFLIGKFLLAWYLALTTTPSIYGAASSLVGFLIWIYYSSQLVFFTAELIQARRTRKEWLKR